MLLDPLRRWWRGEKAYNASPCLMG